MCSIVFIFYIRPFAENVGVFGGVVVLGVVVWRAIVCYCLKYDVIIAVLCVFGFVFVLSGCGGGADRSSPDLETKNHYVARLLTTSTHNNIFTLGINSSSNKIWG